jgi:hypothetical protein
MGVIAAAHPAVLEFRGDKEIINLAGKYKDVEVKGR